MKWQFFLYILAKLEYGDIVSTFTIGTAEDVIHDEKSQELE